MRTETMLRRNRITREPAAAGRTFLILALILCSLLLSLNSYAFAAEQAPGEQDAAAAQQEATASEDGSTYVVEGSGDHSGYTLSVVEDPEPADLEDEEVPLAPAPVEKNWGVANLLLLLIICAMAVIRVMPRLRKRGAGKPAVPDRGAFAADVLAVAAALAAIAAFFLLEDFSEGPGLTDRHTILMGYLFFMELIGTLWRRKSAAE